jgi:tRNA(fMet)-specific endonuclease VapC
MKTEASTIRGRFNRLAAQLAVSSITFAELAYGVEKSGRRQANVDTLQALIARLDVLPFHAKAAQHFGEIRAELERSGTPVGPFDMLIGAHARAEGLIVVTDNVREFERIPGLVVENWL